MSNASIPGLPSTNLMSGFKLAHYQGGRCLKLAGNRRMITMQTNLSALVAVSAPAGGEMSGLTAHFLFGAKAAPPKRTTRGKHSGSTAAEGRRP
jgi:hypothetical protein